MCSAFTNSSPNIHRLSTDKRSDFRYTLGIAELFWSHEPSCDCVGQRHREKEVSKCLNALSVGRIFGSAEA
jgi:hypothetical protein